MLESLGLALGLGEVGVIFHFTLFVGLVGGGLACFLIFSPQFYSPTNEASSTLHCSLGSLGGVSMFLNFSPQFILPSIMLAGPEGSV